MSNQFGNARYALLFKPGTYNVDANVGFFTQVAGLGLTPDQVTINGQVHAEADWWPDGSQNATQNFWRSAEGLSVTPTGGLDRWAVSQAAPYRRMHVRGNLALSDGGWSSGGFIVRHQDRRADPVRLAAAVADPQLRDGQLERLELEPGLRRRPGRAGAAASRARRTPRSARRRWSREKPYLYVDGSRRRTRSSSPACGPTRPAPPGPAATRPGSRCRSARSTSSSPATPRRPSTPPSPQGKNLLVTPGVYHLEPDAQRDPGRTPSCSAWAWPPSYRDNGITAMTVADVDGVRVAGLLFDAGTTNSHGPDAGRPGRLVGDPRRRTRPCCPTCSSGSAARSPARPPVSLRINSDNVIGDHTWIWRADHGNGGTRRLDHQPGRQRPGRQRRQRDLLRPVRRALPAVPDDLERRERAHVLLPERDALRPAEPGRLHERRRRRAGPRTRSADSVNNHEAWGLGSYAFFNANPRWSTPTPSRCRRSRRQVPQHGDRLAGRHRHHLPRHQQHRAPRSTAATR